MSVTLAVTGQALIHTPLNVKSDGAAVVRAFLKADVTIGNFEGVVETPGGWPTKTKTLHAAPADVVASLAALGFTAMAHANNHAFDLGPPGIAATHAAMRRHGILLAGSGATLAEAMRPAEWSVGGQAFALFSVDLGPQADIVYAGEARAGIAPLRVRRTIVLPEADLAVIARIHEATGDAARLAARRKVGYSPEVDNGLEAFGTRFVHGDRVAVRFEPDPADFARLVEGLRAAKSAGRIVLLTLHSHHWDADWTVPPPWYDALTRDLVDAGADVILGTGAPVLQPMRIHRDRAILPGLGNLIFHTARAATYDAEGVDVWRSVAARLTLDRDGALKDIDVLPLRVSRLEAGASSPEPLDGTDASSLRARFLGR
jgi:poly-gamma-glutamate synthesis protein (capsule biosynthesis protein)